jgi:hypothetical protein
MGTGLVSTVYGDVIRSYENAGPLDIDEAIRTARAAAMAADANTSAFEDAEIEDVAADPEGAALSAGALEILPALAESTTTIRQHRPATVTLNGREVQLRYDVESGSGVEYVCIDVQLPDGWVAQTATADLDVSDFAELWSICLPLE